MMYFLVRYDRTESRLALSSFGERKEANRALEAALEKFRGQSNMEVALFQSKDEATFRRTHNRYFQKPDQIIEELKRATQP